MKKTITNITSESSQNQIIADVFGAIKKICIKSESPLENVSVRFVTSEGEIIYSTKLSNEVMLLYPWNFIDVQGRGDFYYSFGNLNIFIEGLQDGQYIDFISVFYT